MTTEQRLGDLEARVKALEHRLLTQQKPVNNPGKPTLAEVRVHFAGCGRSDAEADYEGFYSHYEAVNWVSGTGQQITNWKHKASEWMRKNPAPVDKIGG